MSRQRKQTDAEERFNDFYRQQYPDRWDSLKTAMLEEHAPVAFQEGLETPYYLDSASIRCARLLGTEAQDYVLDMCAAPGGKTLVIASTLKGTGRLVCNDRSSTRRARLHRVIETHLKEVWRTNITIQAHDAARWGLYEQQIYDKILLDAPCSSERHVLKDAHYLAQWTPNRPKRLSVQQFAMLAAALEAVKIGGTILYSTCAIAKEEDEGIIEKLFKKRPGRFRLVEIDEAGSEPCKYGRIILPDKAQGQGPMYFCKLERLS
ncbi:MAG: RsmB/NOP family class I SAM-dependent RNA methyltransferase [Spirochaetia bacterium]|nr:RsmB/NOP family class I SAM-dependent RNA methyltransferase [Spirochaetia bacterium]